MSTNYLADMAKVAQKLANKLADAQYQLTQMEVIAETLRNERDAARSMLSQTLDGSGDDAEV